MRLPNLRRLAAGSAAALLLAGCGATSVAATGSDSGSTTSATSVTVSDGTTVDEALADNVEVETADLSYDGSDVSDIDLSAESGTVTISEPGTYRLTGSLDGQVVVDSSAAGQVTLVLDDATISSDTTAAINVVDAESVAVVLADGSANSLSDATSYDDTSEDAPTGALYSTADLTIGGTGSLTVTGNANNGIVGKDGLVITGGTIEVTSVDDGIIGKDYLVITDGTVAVDAVDDAIKSDNTEDQGTGFVLISGGDVTVDSQDDGIKGTQVLISGGTVEVATSTEALEAALVIIDDGDVDLHAADDGLNVSSSADSSSTQQGPGGGEMAADSSLNLYVNGGTLDVWSSGDGLDSNGNATITGGTITVNGPTSDGNGALDVNGTFSISGGTLVALGSSGMMVAPSTDSAQAWLATALTSTAAAGSTVRITDSGGTEVASFTTTKDTASVVYSSAELTTGETYTVTVDGTSTEVTAGEAPAGGMGGPMGH